MVRTCELSKLFQVLLYQRQSFPSRRSSGWSGLTGTIPMRRMSHSRVGTLESRETPSISGSSGTTDEISEVLNLIHVQDGPTKYARWQHHLLFESESMTSDSGILRNPSTRYTKSWSVKEWLSPTMLFKRLSTVTRSFLIPTASRKEGFTEGLKLRESRLQLNSGRKRLVHSSRWIPSIFLSLATPTTSSQQSTVSQDLPLSIRIALFLHGQVVTLSNGWRPTSHFPSKRLTPTMGQNTFLSFTVKYPPGVSLITLQTLIVPSRMAELKDSTRLLNMNTLHTKISLPTFLT